MHLWGFQTAGWATVGKACAVALALSCAAPTSGYAQKAPPPPPPIDPFAAGEIVDFREQMRAFVQSISAFARSVNPRFVVIAKDGMGLVGKPDPADDTIVFPATAYMRALDGVIETGLLDETVTTPEGKPDPELAAAVKRRGDNLATAQNAGLKVFALEFATEPKAVDAHYAAMTNKGLTPFVPEGPELATIPRHPASAYKASAKPIATAAEVGNFLYIANAQGLGDTGAFLQALRATNHDILVIDVFQGGKPLTRDDIGWLKYKRLGAPRLVLAQVNISSAASFDYFWQPDWTKGSPPYLYAPVRTDPDRMRAIYWDADWQTIFAGDFNSYIYGVIDLGFDGVVLTGVDGWRFFEAGGNDE